MRSFLLIFLLLSGLALATGESVNLPASGGVTPNSCGSGLFADGIAANGTLSCANPSSGSAITALTGDGTASGPGSAALTLKTVNSNVGSFTNASVTVNAKGLVTAASSGSAPVTSVSGSSPISSSGGTTPDISISQSNSGADGYLSSTDWNTFNGKQGPLSFTNSLVNSAGTVALVNDSATPGNSVYYGTNGSGTLGYYAITSGALPGGIATNIQYQINGTTFGGLTGSAVDSAKGFMGVNQSTPDATVDAGIYTSIVSPPASLTTSGYTVGIAGGYIFGSSTNTYQIYSKDTIAGQDFYSSTSTSGSASGPTATDYDPTVATAAINYSESGYTASGFNFTYTVWALYPNSSISLNDTVSTQVTDDNSSNPFAIDVSWTAPISTQTPIGYLVENTGDNPNNGLFQVISGISFTDNNTNWASSASYSPLTYGVNLSWPAATGANNYVLDNTFSTSWQLTGNVTSFLDTGAGTSGTPTVTPNSYDYPTLNSEGTTSLVNGGTGLLGFFGTAPVAQQTGDVVAALENSGLISSGLYSAGLLYYQGDPSHPVFNGTSLLYDDGSVFADMYGKVFTFGGGYTFDAFGNLGVRTLVIGTQISDSAPISGQIYWSSTGGSLEWYNGSYHAFLLDSVALGTSAVTGMLPLSQGGNGNVTSGTTDFTGQTAAKASVAAVASANGGTYRVGGYLTITAVSLDVIQLQVSYTDETNTVRTQTFFPQGLTSASLATTGAYNFPPMDIRVKNFTSITISTVLTTGTGSIVYDVGATIFRLE